MCLHITYYGLVYTRARSNNSLLILPAAGRTCLHLLAQDAAMSSHEITWDGLHVTVSKAWLRMAKLLVLHGCRPGPDSSGEFPHESAKRNGLLKLATYLEQVWNLGNLCM